MIYALIGYIAAAVFVYGWVNALQARWFLLLAVDHGLSAIIALLWPVAALATIASAFDMHKPLWAGWRLS